MQIPFCPARSFVDGRHYSRSFLLAGVLVVLIICVMLTLQFVAGPGAGMKFKESEPGLNFGLLAVVVALVGGFLFCGFYRYSTERELAQDQLRLAARLFESSRESIFVADRDKNIISVNRAFTEITGFA